MTDTDVHGFTDDEHDTLVRLIKRNPNRVRHMLRMMHLEGDEHEDEVTETPVFRDRVPLTPEEFAREADHIWLNALLCVNPSDEFAADLGRMIIRKVMHGDLKTAPMGNYDGSWAAVFWVNAS